MPTYKDFKEAVINARRGEGVYWLKMGETEDGTDLCLVIGWGEGYELDLDLIQDTSGGNVYTLCAKLAINVDDLQCDYGVDWYMPYERGGEVYDTDMAVKGTELEWEWYVEEAKTIIDLYNKGTLVCD